jgi:hypothetical protein
MDIPYRGGVVVSVIVRHLALAHVPIGIRGPSGSEYLVTREETS